MSDAENTRVGLFVLGVALAKVLQLRANPDHAARFIDWLTFRDPFGVELWRRHWHRELVFLAAACLALLLVVRG